MSAKDNPVKTSYIIIFITIFITSSILSTPPVPHSYPPLPCC
jgi:hypothetical protein